MATGIESLAALAVSASATGAVGTAPALGSDVLRFQSAMAAAPSPVAGPAERLPVDLADTGSVRPASGSLGDAILGALDSNSSQLRTRWSQAAQALEQPNLQMSDVVRLQMAVLESSIQFELLSKGITKANHSLDQLLRTQ